MNRYVGPLRVVVPWRLGHAERTRESLVFWLCCDVSTLVPSFSGCMDVTGGCVGAMSFPLARSGGGRGRRACCHAEITFSISRFFVKFLLETGRNCEIMAKSHWGERLRSMGRSWAVCFSGQVDSDHHPTKFVSQKLSPDDFVSNFSALKNWDKTIDLYVKSWK